MVGIHEAKRRHAVHCAMQSVQFSMRFSVHTTHAGQPRACSLCKVHAELHLLRCAASRLADVNLWPAAVLGALLLRIAPIVVAVQTARLVHLPPAPYIVRGHVPRFYFPMQCGLVDLVSISSSIRAW